MAGRYAGELFVRVVGDRDAAPAYLPAARALMGEVLEQAGFNQLGTHSLRQQLKDGTVLVAEKIGEINRVTIAPPPPRGAKRPLRVFEDLLVSGGSLGATAEQPAIILSPSETGWAAAFASSDAPGYYEGAGTYRDVFFNLDGATPHTPCFGNTYDVNPAGVVVSWLSAVQFLPEQGRNPNSLYGSGIRCLGKDLFSVAAYRDHETLGDYPHVMAAAVDSGYLVVLAAALGDLNFDVMPAAPRFRYDVWATPAYSDQPHPTAMFRIKLVEREDPLTLLRYYEADLGPLGVETLWSGSLVRGYGRWNYDHDAHAFASVQLPREANLLCRATAAGTGPDPRVVPIEWNELSDDEVVFRVSGDGVETSPAGDVVFACADGDIAFDLSATAADYVTPARRIPAFRWDHDARLRVHTSIVYADVRNDRYVLVRRSLHMASLGGLETETVQAAALEQGVETPFGAPGTYTMLTPGSTYEGALGTYFAQLAVGGSGIARLCHSLAGHVDSGTGTRISMLQGGRMWATWVSAYSVGTRAGVFSFSDPTRDIIISPPPTLRWGTTQYYSPDLATGPVPNPNPAPTNVNGAGSYASTAKYTAAYVQSAETPPSFGGYLTGGDLPTLTGGALDGEAMSFCPLGKPLMSQKRERPA